MRVKTAYCIDVSGSMTTEQLVEALNKVSDYWQHDDLVYIFDHASAEPITFQDVVDYSLQINDVNDLRFRLFKRGTYHRWQGSGASKAAMLAPNHCTKVCVTDGYLLNDDFKEFKKIIKIQ